MTGDGVLALESPLATLVVACADGGFAADGFARIDARLRADRLGSEGHFLLPVLEPCLRSHVPDWDYLPIAGGLRRRSRLETAMAGQLAEAVQQQLHIRGVNAVLIGDLAAARVLHGQVLGPGGTGDEAGVRRASQARLLVPGDTSRGHVREALRSTAEEAGATLLDRPRSGLRLHGALVRVSAYPGVLFTFPQARDAIWQRVQPPHLRRSSQPLEAGDRSLPTPSAEYLMFESIAASGYGPPRIRWLVDAVAARKHNVTLDWDEVITIAREHHWSAPVHSALRYLVDVGFHIPESALAQSSARDTAVDLAVQRMLEQRSGTAGARRAATLAPLLAARTVRHWRGQ